MSVAAGADPTFEYVRRLVREEAAIQLDERKDYLIRARLSCLAQSEGLPSVDALLAGLAADPALRRKVVEAMTTNETSFFRDVHPFETLREVVLPGLIERRAGSRRIDIWSAACSSGQEPYSLAMLIREHFPALQGWNVRILAMDLSRPILDRARAGRYSRLEVNRGLPARLLVRHFRADGDAWRISDELRRMVEFRELNLAGPWPGLPRFDLVFMRNVLIYFDAPTKTAILERTAEILRPDGLLFLGGAESTISIPSRFRRVQIGRTGCYRLDGGFGSSTSS